MMFNQLDADKDSALDFQEFSVFAGDVESARNIFQAMDFDHDNFITEEEILRAIQMLQQPTTEATNPPVNGPTLYTDGTPLEPNGTTGADATNIAIPEPVPAANTTSTPDGSLAVDSDQISQKISKLLTGISNTHSNFILKLCIVSWITAKHVLLQAFYGNSTH